MACASRSSAQSLSEGTRSASVKFASCTNRKGISGCFHASRQQVIIRGKRVLYWNARGTFDSPWYQMAPLTGIFSRGYIMPL